MADKKPGNTEATVMGLPEVRNDATQMIDESVGGTDPAIRTDPLLAAPVMTAPSLAPVESAPQLEPVPTAPSLPPVVEPPRTKTGGIPRTKTAGTVPKPEAQPRRASRVAAELLPEDEAAGIQTAEPLPKVKEKPLTPTLSPQSQGEGEPFEWTMPRVAGVAGAVSLLAILLWVFWPSKTPKRVRPEPTEPEPIAVADPTPKPKPAPAPSTPKPVAAPAKPTLALDAKLHVIDPYAAHAADLPLDPAHKYRLRIERDDPRLGTALARLEDTRKGWGVMNKMASHAMLQFGGAKTLRLHCEPGARFADGAAFPLELTDLANKKKVPVPLAPAKDCWDFEVARRLDLGEGVKRRVRVPTDAKVQLGPDVPLRVAYVLESLGDKTEWRTGVLGPGESVLAEGRSARFAVLDSYAGDNEGTVALELLDGDTENAGLVTPSASGTQFVPVK